MPEAWGRLSVVLPMFNEAEGFDGCLASVMEAGVDLAERGRVSDFEIIVVDDGSSDGTAALADAAAAANPRVHVVHHPANRGLGAAVRSGLGEASGELLLYTDADLPADLSEIDTALDLLADDDVAMVAAYRLHRLPDGLKRLVYSIIWNALVQVALGVHVRDVNFAFKLTRSSGLEVPSLRSESSFIDAEMVARVLAAGGRIEQFGTPYRPRTVGSSTLGSVPVIKAMLADLIRLGPTLRRARTRAVATDR